jgi:cytochrome c oxidase subunit I
MYGSSHAHHDESFLAPKATLMQTIWSWVYTIDHKKIGVMYLVAVLIAFFLGGVFALIMRTELWEPVKTVMENGVAVPEGQWLEDMTIGGKLISSNNLYNRAFSLHGTVMVFLFIIPSIPAALGNIFLPIMLGAKDVAFPRLNLLSWYTYVFGGIFALWALIGGGVETGWTFYTPYSSTTNWGNVTAMVLAAFILGFSSIFTGMNFVATVHKLRVPGMGWFDMPLFVWAIYATAIIQVLATPVLGITLLMIVFERVFHIGIFDPNMGGDPVLFQHFFWFYSHPAVYIMILPGMGIISEIIAVHCRKRLFGYRAIAFSSLAIAAISFLVWGHHLFMSETAAANFIFSGLTFLVAIPTAIKVFNWVATMYKASIRLDTPMLYAMSFLFNFTIGGVTGPPLATLAADIHLHDTYFVVAHFHYVMMGGTVFAFVGGLHHWWPKMFGKMYNEFYAKIGTILVFLGFNITFFTQFFLGTQGMPRRYATYIEEFTTLHQISTVGSYMLGFGMLVHLLVFIQSLVGGKPAPKNPWGGITFEWQADSPPVEHNFHHEPVITHGPYDYETTIPPHCDPKDYPLHPDAKRHAH